MTEPSASTEREALIATIVAWLEEQRQAYADIARDWPRVQVTVPVQEPLVTLVRNAPSKFSRPRATRLPPSLRDIPAWARQPKWPDDFGSSATLTVNREPRLVSPFAVSELAEALFYERLVACDELDRRIEAGEIEDGDAEFARIDRWQRLDGERKRLAHAIEEAFGKRCQIWSPEFREPIGLYYPKRARDDYPLDERDPGWVECNLLCALNYDYLSSLQSLDVADREAATQLVESLIRLLESDDILICTRIPLRGIGSAEQASIRHGPVAVLVPAAEELEAIGIDAGMGIDSPTPVTLEVREPIDKGTLPRGGTAHLAERVLLAFQLLGFVPYGPGVTTRRTEPGPSLDLPPLLVPLPRTGTERPCSEEDLKQAVTLAHAISPNVFVPGEDLSVKALTLIERRRILAIRRFAQGAVRDNAEDAIIDFCTCLEGVLVESKGEIRQQFGLNGALLLAKGQDERERAFRHLRNIYDDRSDLVHGNKAFAGTELHTAAASARDCAARVLVRCLEHGWPTAEDFRRLAFDG